MTAAQMHREAEILYESIASQSAPGYTETEWSYILTQAQEKFINTILDEGLDKDDNNRLSIQALIRNCEATEFEAIDKYLNGYIFISNPFPEGEAYRILNERAQSGYLVDVQPIEYEFYKSNRNNPFKNPDEDTYWRLIGHEYGDNFIIITDGSVLTSYYIEYITKPEPIIVPNSDIGTVIDDYTVVTSGATGYEINQVDGKDCILAIKTHRRIVEIAARLAEKYVQDQVGYQLGVIEQRQNN